MSRKVWNDRLSRGQLDERIRAQIKTELRRRDGVLTEIVPITPIAPTVKRFIQPYRVQTSATAVTINNNGAANVDWLLVAGAKPLKIKRILIQWMELKASALGSNAHRLTMHKFWFPNIVQLGTTGASITACAPVCLSKAQELSTAFTCMSSGSTVISTTSTLLGANIGPPMAGVGVTNCNTSAAIRRFSCDFEWKNPNDRNLFVLEPFNGLLIRSEDSATGEAWPSGFVEWEE